MKIVYFNYLHDLYDGSLGSTIKAIELMSALENQGHEVKSFWLNARSAGGDESSFSVRGSLKKRFDKYLHEPNQILRNIKYISEEIQILRKEKPDLIISRLDVYLLSTLVLSKLKRIPWLLEADAPAVYESRKFLTHYAKLPYLDALIEKLNVRMADRIIVVSKEAKDYFLKYRLSEGKIHVVPNAVDVTKFHPGKESSLVTMKHQLQNKVVIGFVGSMHYWHGVSNLLKVLDAILSVDEKVVFMILGQGGAKEAEFKEFVAKKRYQDRVILPGFVPHEEVPRYIAAMDIVLAPYPKLDFFYYSPMKIYEYLACGKAVVASKIGQIQELITDNYNGMLCEPGDIDQIIGKTQELVEDENLRNSIGKQAWESVSVHHTWVQRAEKISEICEMMVSRGSIPFTISITKVQQDIVNIREL